MTMPLVMLLKSRPPFVDFLMKLLEPKLPTGDTRYSVFELNGS